MTGHAEEPWLAGYALCSAASAGRVHAEPAHPFRQAYQRDRERIVHSSAFRRMTGKTQVLLASVNDHHRTRLTHTLEVTQVARTVARRLRLNEDLTEAVALSHDMGHPPFGHAGEQALHGCLLQHGGFNHNLYGLRRVDHLEERYPEFPGLNLTYEVREAFVRHSGVLDSPEATEFNKHRSPPLESQVVDVVDSITYDTHDTDDALGLGFITLAQLADVELWQRSAARVQEQYPGLAGEACRTAVVRELLAYLVTDLISETQRRIDGARIRTVADVRAHGWLVDFSEPVLKMKVALEQFLGLSVYRHHKVLRMTANGQRVLRALFAEYTRAPELLPTRHYHRWAGAGVPCALPGRRREPCLEVVVADYLAGMTDRYAQQDFRRLFHPPGDL